MCLDICRLSLAEIHYDGVKWWRNSNMTEKLLPSNYQNLPPSSQTHKAATPAVPLKNAKPRFRTQTICKKQECPSGSWGILYSPLYIRLVAIPPRICRSILFRSSTFLTCTYSRGLHWGSRSWISLCTVDLEIPKCFAAARTVAPVSMMYTASSQALCSMVWLNCLPPMLCAEKTYAQQRNRMPNIQRKFMIKQV